MLEALVEGKATPQEMAELAKGRLRQKIDELGPDREVKLEEHHRFLLRLHLDRLEAAEKDLAVLEQRLQEKLKPYAEQLTLLDEIPGVDWTLAAVIIAELGVDMSVFGSVSQLASWAGVCPGNNESAGKRKSSRIPKGNVYLKTALVEAANSAAKAKGTYLRDKFYRLKARRGYKRAAVAVAHKILVAIYHMFSDRVCYNELGDVYLDKLNKHHLTRNLVHRLERLGYTVTLEQKGIECGYFQSRLRTKGELRSPKAVSLAATRAAAPPRYASSISFVGEGFVASASIMMSMLSSFKDLKYPDLV